MNLIVLLWILGGLVAALAAIAGMQVNLNGQVAAAREAVENLEKDVNIMKEFFYQLAAQAVQHKEES